MAYETILYAEDGPIGTITLNRPDDGNMFTPVMCHEVRDCINDIRRETRTRVIVLTGAGEKFFCIGGRKEGMEDTTLYAGTLPTLEMYEAIEKLQKPVIASVNGFAVGGGNVLQMLCDCTVAKESAVFRQVGPMMGSFDAGYGTWYLEDLVGKEARQGNLVPQPEDLRARGAGDGADQQGGARTPSLRRRPASSRWRSPSAGHSRWRRSRRHSMRAMAACRACRAWRTICCCAPISRPTRARSCPRRLQASASPIRRSSASKVGRLAVRPFLTLHHPAQARRYYEQGVWQADTFYGCWRGMRRSGRMRIALAGRPAHVDMD